MIEKLPEIKESFESFAEMVFEGKILDERDKALVALSIVTTLEDEEAVKNAVMACKQTMISNEEIGHVIAIVMAMKGQKVSRLFKVEDKIDNDSTQRCC